MSTFEEIVAAVDRALAELGFERSSKLRRIVWQGRYDGRPCSVSVAPQSRTRYAGEVRVRQHLGWRLRAEMGLSARVLVFFVRETIAENAVVR